jgi:uncharacterized protein YidB (DUF937 family)
MSILGTIKGMMGGEGGESAGLMSHAMELVNSPETGGLQGLVQQFHDKGMGDIVNSWIGPGGNHPITADQIQQVLGQNRIAAIASKFGMSTDDASAKIAQLLPTIVDKMTPGGAMPKA